MKLIHISKNDAGDFDIELEDGIFRMSEDGEAAAVSMTERVLTVRSEALANPLIDIILNPLAGVDWYGIIFRSDATRAEKETELKRAILSTPGIEGIIRWNWAQTGRTVTIDVKVKSEWGTLGYTEEVTPL